MNTLENLGFLRQNALNVYHQLRNDVPDNFNYRVTDAKKCAVPTIEKLLNGRWTPLHSRFNPVDEAITWVKAINTKLESEPSNIVLFGFGLGYHAIELMKAYPRANFYIFEPDKNVALFALEYFDWSKLAWKQIKNFTIARSNNCKEVFINNIIKEIEHGWEVLALPAYERLNEEYNQFSNSFIKIKDIYLNSLKTNLVFEKKWNYNVLKNLHAIVNTPSIFDFKEYFADKPVIMTASGPSLEQAISLIKKVQKENKAYIVAAGSSVHHLLKHNIVPDFFVSYDPTYANYQGLESVLDKQVPFVFGSTIYHEIVECSQSDRAHFILSQDTIYPALDRSFDKKEWISDAPTITAVTMQLLIKLGVKTIILAGQDLTYVDDKFYASGTSKVRSDNITEEERETTLFVANNLGGKSKTSKTFMYFKDSIELVLRANVGVEVYNLSGYGAKIEGAEYLKTDSAWKMLQNSSVPELKFKSDTKRKIDLTQELKKINKSILYYKQQVAILEKLFSNMNVDYENGEKSKETLLLIDKHLKNITSHKHFYHIIGPFIKVRLHLTERALSKLGNTNQSSMAKFEKSKLYSYYQEDIRHLVTDIKGVLDFYNDIFAKNGIGDNKHE